MPGRPARSIIALQLVALAGAVVFALARAEDANWELPLLLLLLGLSITADLTAIESPSHRIKLSGSFLTIVIAIAFLGATPAAIVGVATILAGWTRSRYPWHDLLINLVTYSWYALIAGVVFREVVQSAGIPATAGLFYLLIFGAFALALAINFVLIAGYSCYLEGSRFRTKVRRALVPVLPSEFASAVLAVGIAYVYVQIGLAAMALFGIALLTFQYMIGALLVSQERGDELEFRARQLAGFQMGLLSALVHTLDLRDRMTARHSAAVARYTREIAAAAGVSKEQQDLAHTAGLLHDIGKFVFPDHILKAETKLTEDDWTTVRKHPEEGARIVSQIDGYRPVGEIILAHHERIDGLGYPQGLRGDEIPEIARMMSVADTYDVMTARDSYRQPVSSFEAIEELRRVAGTQLDGRFVEIFVGILETKDLAYRHGEDADFETELAFEKRIHDYVATPGRGEQVGLGNGHRAQVGA